MSDSIRINIVKAATVLTIAVILAGMVGAAYIGYDNAKTAKQDTAALAVRMTAIELDYAKFKGIMEERTKNIQENVSKIYDIVKEWQPETVKTTTIKGI